MMIFFPIFNNFVDIEVAICQNTEKTVFTNRKLIGLTVNYAIFSCHRSGVVFSVRPFSTCSVYRSGRGKVLVDRLCKLKVTYQN